MPSRAISVFLIHLAHIDGIIPHAYFCKLHLPQGVFFFNSIIILPQLIKSNLISSEDRTRTVIVEMDHILSSQSPTDRHLDPFQFPALINNTLKQPVYSAISKQRLQDELALGSGHIGVGNTA